MNVVPERAARRARSPAQPARVEAVAKATADTAQPDPTEADVAPAPVDIMTRPQSTDAEGAVAKEAKKGYDLLVIGVEPVAEKGVFDERLARLAAEFKGSFAIAEARGSHRRAGPGRALDIVVPVTGTGFSRRGAEVALALARADHGSVTALYVASPARPPWRRAMALGADEEAILREVVRLGDRMEVTVRTVVRTNAVAADGILRQVRAGKHNLVVMGVSPRPGETLFFGGTSASILDRSERSILFVAS